MLCPRAHNSQARIKPGEKNLSVTSTMVGAHNAYVVYHNPSKTPKRLLHKPWGTDQPRIWKLLCNPVQTLFTRGYKNFNNYKTLFSFHCLAQSWRHDTNTGKRENKPLIYHVSAYQPITIYLSPHFFCKTIFCESCQGYKGNN